MQSNESQVNDMGVKELPSFIGVPILHDNGRFLGILQFIIGLIDFVLVVTLACLPTEYRTKKTPFESFWWGIIIGTFALCAGFSGFKSKDKKFLLFAYAVASCLTLLSSLCGMLWIWRQLPILIHYLKLTEFEGYQYAWAHFIITLILLMTFSLQAMIAEFGAIIPYAKLCCGELHEEQASVRDVQLPENECDPTKQQESHYSRQIETAFTVSSEVYYSSSFPTSSLKYSYPRRKYESPNADSLLWYDNNGFDKSRSNSEARVQFEAYDNNSNQREEFHHIYIEDTVLDESYHVSNRGENIQIEQSYYDEGTH